MLKGVGRQIVVVKDVGSDLFEQAIFIVNPGKYTEGLTETDMAQEAKKIVGDYIRSYGGRCGALSKKKGFTRRKRFNWRKYWIAAAAACAVVLATVVSLALFL